MNEQIEIKKVADFYKQIVDDNNHRYKSWEHCFNYFLKPKEEIEVDKACLHLAFYLASWGMYRGSSYLLQKDYLIHKKLIEEVILHKKFKPLQTWNFNGEDNVFNIKLLFELKEAIEEHYKKEITHINGKIKEKLSVSDVLSTKIILGTFGCVPAYDRYFISGLKEYDKKFGFTFNEQSFENLIDVYKNNSDNIDALSKEQTCYEHKYPIMKILDMYFWQIGFEKESEIEKVKKKLKRNK